MLSKENQVKELIEDLRSVPGAALSREGCLFLADFIEEQLKTIEGQQTEIDWLRSLPLCNE